MTEETNEKVNQENEAVLTETPVDTQTEEGASAHTPLDAPLEIEANDWLPDHTTPTTQPDGPAADDTVTGPVALIQDPFGFPTIEINEAHSTDEELNLDDDSLEGVAQAIAEEDEKYQEEVEAQAKATEEDEAVTAAEQLAREIAEDEALAREDAQEETVLDPELQAALPQSMDVTEVESCIEALLFMMDKPISTTKLREMLGPDFSLSIFQEAVTSLRDRYNAPNHGIELVEVAGGFQFRTKPGRAALAKKLAKIQAQRLSSGAMETLAIVAYRQPALKEDVDKIRGVDSSYFIRGLLEKHLIKISGRSELPGRPMVYSTTDEFLQLFGLKDLSAMPSLRELEQMVPASQSKNPDDDDPRIKEMRRLVGEMKTDTSGRLNYDPREDEKILKDIREHINAIPTTTPYLEEQKLLEKQAAEQAALAAQAAATPAEPEIGVTPELMPLPATDAELLQNATALNAQQEQCNPVAGDQSVTV